MGMPFTQSSTFIQRRSEVGNLPLTEEMGWNRVAQRMTSTIAGNITATANRRRAYRRRYMLGLDLAVPTATFLGKYYAPIWREGKRLRGKFLVEFCRFVNVTKKDNGSRAGSRLSNLP